MAILEPWWNPLVFVWERSNCRTHWKTSKTAALIKHLQLLLCFLFERGDYSLYTTLCSIIVTLSEQFDHLKQKWLLQSLLSLHRHAVPLQCWTCLFWLSSSKSKFPRGRKSQNLIFGRRNKETKKNPIKSNKKGEYAGRLLKPSLSLTNKMYRLMLRNSSEMYEIMFLFSDTLSVCTV